MQLHTPILNVALCGALSRRYEPKIKAVVEKHIQGSLDIDAYPCVRC